MKVTIANKFLKEKYTREEFIVPAAKSKIVTYTRVVDIIIDSCCTKEIMHRPRATGISWNFYIIK